MARLGLDWKPDDERLVDIKDGMVVDKGSVSFTVRHSPGHTPGSSVYIAGDLRAELVLFSGDLVFAGSVGRTDFPRGSFEQQNQSLARVVLPLPDDTLVLSGHGPETTVGVERRTNPFLQELRGRSPTP
jgi:glyoxylase-like metal-dependent hydrolase (beta-lactamase superfamily II)